MPRICSGAASATSDVGLPNFTATRSTPVGANVRRASSSGDGPLGTTRERAGRGNDSGADQAGQRATADGAAPQSGWMRASRISLP